MRTNVYIDFAKKLGLLGSLGSGFYFQSLNVSLHLDQARITSIRLYLRVLKFDVIDSC